jgi:hypothetical protein
MTMSSSMASESAPLSVASPRMLTNPIAVINATHAAKAISILIEGLEGVYGKRTRDLREINRG